MQQELFKTYEMQTLGRKKRLNDTENLYFTWVLRKCALCLLQGDMGEDCVQVSLGISGLQVVMVRGERC